MLSTAPEVKPFSPSVPHPHAPSARKPRTISTHIHTERDILTHIPPLLNYPSYPAPTLSPLSRGLTNRIFKLSHPSAPPAFVRLFGAADVFSLSDRHRETQIITQLGHHDIAPSVLVSFPTGRVETFLHARPIPLSDATDLTIALRVARFCARMHAFTPDEKAPLQPPIWDSMDKWANSVSFPHSCQPFLDVDVPRMVDAVALLKKRLPHCPLVFAHNDLHAGNILRGVDDPCLVAVVDFEYVGWNYRGYEIGNYFAEAMGGTDDAIMRPHLYPKPHFRNMFCRAYLTESNGFVPDDAAVQALVQEAEAYKLLSNLHWTLWAFMQSSTSSLDFDFNKYARSRLSRFYEDLHEIFGC